MTSATVASTASTLDYDPALRLFKITTGGNGMRYEYDGNEIVTIYTDAGAVSRRFVRGPSADEVLVEYSGSGTGSRTFLHADERGSIVARSDSSGAKTGINSYDEYGIPMSTNAGRFQYTGQLWVPQLIMYYYKARMYSPSLGRFMQTDPIGYGEGLNMNAYVHNDPVNKTDPSGLAEICDANGCIDDGGPELVVCANQPIGSVGCPPKESGDFDNWLFDFYRAIGIWPGDYQYVPGAIGIAFCAVVGNVALGGDAGAFWGAGGQGGASLNYNPRTGDVVRSYYTSSGAGLGFTFGGGLNLSGSELIPFEKVTTLDNSLQVNYIIGATATRSQVEGNPNSNAFNLAGSGGIGAKISAEVISVRTTTHNKVIAHLPSIC